MAAAHQLCRRWQAVARTCFASDGRRSPALRSAFWHATACVARPSCWHASMLRPSPDAGCCCGRPPWPSPQGSRCARPLRAPPPMRGRGRAEDAPVEKSPAAPLTPEPAAAAAADEVEDEEQVSDLDDAPLPAKAARQLPWRTAGRGKRACRRGGERLGLKVTGCSDRGRSAPGSRETNLESVSWDAGERAYFASWETGQGTV